LNRRASDLGDDRPGDVTAAGGTEEVGVDQAGSERIAMATDDRKTFVFEDRPQKSFIEELVDGIAVNLAFATTSIAEPVGIDRDTLDGKGVGTLFPAKLAWSW
jgi:hypothetical protein